MNNDDRAIRYTMGAIDRKLRATVVSSAVGEHGEHIDVIMLGDDGIGEATGVHAWLCGDGNFQFDSAESIPGI